MSGFNTIIGFLFFFFIVTGIVGYSLVAMSGTIIDNVEVIQTNEKMIKDSQVSFSLDNSYEGSGRLKLFMRNDGSSGVVFKDKNNQECLDVYVNRRYVSKSDFENYLGNPLGNYYYLEPGEKVVMEILVDINESEPNEVKIISCSGQAFEYLIDEELYNWQDADYKRRSAFTVFNSGANNLRDSFFTIELNDANFDFSKASDDEIVFSLDLYENSVLDLTFDDYKQTLDDDSRYENTVYLGTGSAAGSDDPSSEDGVFFDSLSFYSGDYVRIVADQSLGLEKGMTISSWVKWNGSGGDSQNIFTNGNDMNALKIINDGGVSDDKVRFDLNVGGLRSLYSNVTIGDGNWHHVAATFDGTYMFVYIDGENAGSLSVAGDVDTYFNDNFIGRDMAGGSMFAGSIDDFKVYNFALNSSEIYGLFHNNYFYKSLNYIVDSWDKVSKEANVSVEIPFIGDNNENITIDLYYYKYGDDAQ